MRIEHQASLKQFHTFSIEVGCDVLVEATSVDELIQCYQNPDWANLPKLVLGKGSNMLFTEHFKGVVILNRLMGKEVTESELAYHLHINGGEDWPELVAWSLKQGYDGLENLALIPGCVGSSPIQNIGAYGVELKDVCEYVEYLCLETFTIKRLSKHECEFGYRDSIFKHQLHGKAVITAVGITLNKQWQAKAQYGPLKAIDAGERNAQTIFNTVCDIRMEKLPDPAVLGNAGSFFKNPVVSQDQYQALKLKYPNLVGYEVEHGVKLAAGWLIDNAGLKGVSVGGAQVHQQQALVLVNHDRASAQDVLGLAKLVTERVKSEYGVSLEHEVRFMGQSEETHLQQWIENHQ
ncbi:UDP-N-acetylmuramate dehydrogenase [Vibrio sp. SCSIO 43136]|uniref:UDP-N-acetylmuramate dehydrogenase n=1 Tax=Vibrio sp. SCSIO 43136 TaxID=2819101 RepID=UPI0020755301|nr:UDP-N-acetylmuramate dehydrogenase [Vibrio sp. SCSIO 43136]USD65415.1 UDP-N-acetylmuramate dehydrogenase [Vibrio sp. SCSIO 43136]